MKRKSLIFVALLMCTLTGSAQDERGFWNRGFGKWLKSLDDYAKEREHKGFDSAYVEVPERDRMIFVGSNMAVQRFDLHFPIPIEAGDFPGFIQQYYLPSNISELMYVEPRFRTSKLGVQVGINWRGISLALPIPLNHHYSKSYALASNGSKFGFRVTYRTVNNVTGRIMDPFIQANNTMQDNMADDVFVHEEMREHHEPITAVERDIENGSMDLKTFYAEAYYVFNNRKFSMAAGLSGNKLQKRSTGSVIAMMNYFQSSLGCNEMLAAERDEFRNQMLSAGIGYAYNLSLLRGRLCLHGSVVPMFSMVNRVTHKIYHPEEETEYDGADPEAYEIMKQLFEPYHAHFYNAVDNAPHSRFKVNGFLRLSVNYFFSRYLLTAQFNYRKNAFGNSMGMTMKDYEADFRVRLGYRF